MRGANRLHMPRLECFPFRFRDPVKGKWLRARYPTERHVITERYKDTEWEITGPAEIRGVIRTRASSTLGASPPHAVVVRMFEPAPEIKPHLDRPRSIDATGRFLATLFLRRYVTYCARRRPLPEIQGAERLLAEIAATA